VELMGLVLHQRYKIYEQAGTSGMATICLAREIATSALVRALVLEPPITRDAGVVSGTRTWRPSKIMVRNKISATW
jgi:hypothetical protein